MDIDIVKGTLLFLFVIYAFYLIVDTKNTIYLTKMLFLPTFRKEFEKKYGHVTIRGRGVFGTTIEHITNHENYKKALVDSRNLQKNIKNHITIRKMIDIK